MAATATATDETINAPGQDRYRDRIMRLNLDDIEPPRVHLREVIDQENVLAIAHTIAQDGLYHLPGVRRVGHKRF